MLGVSSAKLIVGAAVLLAVGLTIYLAFNHYDGLLTKIDDLTREKATLEGNVVVLEGVVKDQQATVNAAIQANGQWQEKLEEFGDDLREMQAADQAAGEYSRKLNDTLAKHDLQKLTKAKPSLVETRINAGSDRALRMLEQSANGTHPDGDGAGGPAPAGPVPQPAPGPSAAPAGAP